MDEIISYKLCAVKVRNAKLQNYLKSKFDCNSTSHQPGAHENADNIFQTGLENRGRGGGGMLWGGMAQLVNRHKVCKQQI